ncbi:MAG TPA: tetratricopeptide repeat protein [Tepidisphaeraceae bacterium]|nr:tetratricopeptide repeat protein [Tepidisphaeraceae bacterium]
MTRDVQSLILRAELLLQQGRYPDAERELGQLLAHDPRHPLAHALMAHAMLGQLRMNDAEYAAREAVRSAPDEAFAHYAVAAVLRERRRYAEAAEAIEAAIGLNPYSPDQFAMLAQIRCDQREWSAALEAADQGLSIDPEHSGCVNLRAIALLHLGRRGEAASAVQGALDRDPENSVTHANQGWNYLHHNDPKKALEHFREALRLDASNDWARTGIVEAMKARNPVYRVMLAYFLWMSRLSGRTQMAIVFGGWIGQRMLRESARSNPMLGPYVMPIILLYALFVWMTWLASPLFNLTLRLSKYGRHALSREQTKTSNWILALLLLAIGSAASLLLGFAEWKVSAALTALLLTIPVSTIWLCDKGWPRWANVAIALGMAGVGVLLTLLQFTGAGREASEGLFALLLVSAFGSSIAVQFLVRASPTR